MGGAASVPATAADYEKVKEACAIPSDNDTRMAFLGVTGSGKSSLIALLFKACELDCPVTEPSPTIKEYPLSKGACSIKLVDAAGFSKDDMVQATSRQFYVNLLHGCYGWDVYGIPPQPSLSIRSYKDRAHVCVFVFNGKDEWLTSKKPMVSEQGAAGIRWYPIARAARNLHLGSVAIVSHGDDALYRDPENVERARSRIAELLRLDVADVFVVPLTTDKLQGKLSGEQVRLAAQILDRMRVKGDEAHVRLQLEAEGKPVPSDAELQKRSFDLASSRRPSMT